MRRRDSTDTPFLGSPDTLEIKAVEHPFSFPDGADEELNALIVDTVNRMGGVGDDAEAEYQKALERLGQQSAQAVDSVARAYEALPEESYLDRWSLVQLLAELRQPRALKFLDEIIGRPIPEERHPRSHDFSTITEEVMIRTTSVEVVVRLSADGIDDARRVLIRHARHEQFSVRRACVQGLTETGTEEDRKELRTILAEAGEERLLEIRRMDVREVAQARGGRYLVHPDARVDLPPHDLGTRQQEK